MAKTTMIYLQTLALLLIYHLEEVQASCVVNIGQEANSIYCEMAKNDQTSCGIFSTYCTWDVAETLEYCGSSESVYILEGDNVIQHLPNGTTAVCASGFTGARDSVLLPNGDLIVADELAHIIYRIPSGCGAKTALISSVDESFVVSPRSLSFKTENSGGYTLYVAMMGLDPLSSGRTNPTLSANPQVYSFPLSAATVWDSTSEMFATLGGRTHEVINDVDYEKSTGILYGVENEQYIVSWSGTEWTRLTANGAITTDNIRKVVRSSYCGYYYISTDNDNYRCTNIEDSNTCSVLCSSAVGSPWPVVPSIDCSVYTGSVTSHQLIRYDLQCCDSHHVAYTGTNGVYAVVPYFDATFSDQCVLPDTIYAPTCTEFTCGEKVTCTNSILVTNQACFGTTGCTEALCCKESTCLSNDVQCTDNPPVSNYAALACGLDYGLAECTTALCCSSGTLVTPNSSRLCTSSYIDFESAPTGLDGAVTDNMPVLSTYSWDDVVFSLVAKGTFESFSDFTPYAEEVGNADSVNGFVGNCAEITNDSVRTGSENDLGQFFLRLTGLGSSGEWPSFLMTYNCDGTTEMGGLIYDIDGGTGSRQEQFMVSAYDKDYNWIVSDTSYRGISANCVDNPLEADGWNFVLTSPNAEVIKYVRIDYIGTGTIGSVGLGFDNYYAYGCYSNTRISQACGA